MRCLVNNIMAEKEEQINSTLEACHIDGNVFTCKSKRDNFTAISPTALRHAIQYNMTHKHRGLALIFNHEHFNDANIPRRIGSSADCCLLQQSLAHMQFQVKTYNDCSLKELRHHIKRASQQDHSKNDCLLIALLTHSRNERLCAKDGEYYLNDVWSTFTADQCPTLAGKPKLLLVEACENENVAGSTQTEAESTSIYKIPIHADFLIVYSAIGCHELQQGSLFIQCLCNELIKNHKTTHFLELLTFVLQRLHQIKIAVPSINSLLTRILKFEEK